MLKHIEATIYRNDLHHNRTKHENSRVDIDEPDRVFPNGPGPVTVFTGAVASMANYGMMHTGVCVCACVCVCV